MSFRNLWIGFAAVVVISFAVLGWTGFRIYQQAPPVPERVIAADGTQLIGPGAIHAGQNVWQSMGGMELGSIWGHGSYVAPDWTADWLHREAMAWLDIEANHERQRTYAELPGDVQASLVARLKPRIRANTFDAGTETIFVADDRAEAIATVSQHYLALFGNDAALLPLRKAYAMKNNTVTDADNRAALTAFVWWSAWAATTERPNKSVTYTNNWPHEPLVGNTPPGHLLTWTVFSVLFLIAGIALLGWHHARHRDEEPAPLPASDPLALIRVTPSMKATAKYFWLVVALFLT